MTGEPVGRINVRICTVRLNHNSYSFRSHGMTQRQKFATMDEYFASLPPHPRAVLEEIKRIVESEVPGAEATIAYQMPAFRKGRIFIYFAAFKHHVGVYPPAHGDEALQAALLPFRGEKGNLKFPLTESVPVDLIRGVVAALARQYSQP